MTSSHAANIILRYNKFSEQKKNGGLGGLGFDPAQLTLENLFPTVPMRLPGAAIYAGFVPVGL